MNFLEGLFLLFFLISLFTIIIGGITMILGLIKSFNEMIKENKEYQELPRVKTKMVGVRFMNNKEQPNG